MKLPRDTMQLRPDVVAKKLEIKSDSAFSRWLTTEVDRRFNYVCCDDIAIFQRETTAITQAGQIKSNTRHEKDDRTNISDRTRYVLGFSNQKKIDALAKQSAEAELEKRSLEEKKRAVGTQLNAMNDQCNALSVLLTFDDFSALDVDSLNSEIAESKKQFLEIESNNDILSTLQIQLETYQEKQRQQTARVKDLDMKKHDAEKDISTLQLSKIYNDDKVKDAIADKSSYPYLEQNRGHFIGTSAITLNNADAMERKYSAALSKASNDFLCENTELERKIERCMASFRRDYPNETKEMDDTIQSLSEYNQLYEQLQRDDLPRYEASFKNLLLTEVMREITLFQMSLKQLYDSIKVRIDDINRSLYDIDYNAGRYIKILCEDSPDSETRDFRTKLKSCTEGVAGGFDTEALASTKFLQIKELIERFKGRERETDTDKRWTKKVTDVRNWFVFSASERRRESDEEYEHYTDSGGKSGGQKEKLAYTILAASLVYNYGLNEDLDDKSTFRLVAIDEAFLKSSDDSAKFGLQLFKKLKFQLVIVTPLLKISTIEPFISHVGFVSYDDVTHRSALMNISIDEYREKRKEREDENLD